MSFWTNKIVLVTGGSGFMGKHLIKSLQEKDCGEIIAPRSSMFDLREKNQVVNILNKSKPNIVIHLAAVCGGIGANRSQPGKFFYDNAIMGIQLIEEARKAFVEKFVCVGTVCAYPKFAEAPFKEDEIWNGYPEETNAPYGLAKKMLLVQLQAYRQQYDFNGIYLLPVNLYGIGDNFDLRTSHVIPAMIRKFVEAKEIQSSSIELWGSGNVSREFLYINDCVEGILSACENYNKPEPVNLGSGREILVKDLAHKIADILEYKGKINWNPSLPDGQPRRQLDTTRAFNEFGFKASTTLEDGLMDTIAWYLSKKLFNPNEAVSVA